GMSRGKIWTFHLVTGIKIQLGSGPARVPLAVPLRRESIAFSFQAVSAGIEVLDQEMPLGIRYGRGRSVRRIEWKSSNLYARNRIVRARAYNRAFDASLRPLS